MVHQYNRLNYEIVLLKITLTHCKMVFPIQSSDTRMRDSFLVERRNRISDSIDWHNRSNHPLETVTRKRTVPRWTDTGYLYSRWSNRNSLCDYTQGISWCLWRNSPVPRLWNSIYHCYNQADFVRHLDRNRCVQLVDPFLVHRLWMD